MLRLWPLRLLWNFCMCSTTAVPRVGLLRLSGSMYSSDGARCTRCRRFALPGSMKPGVVSGVWQISEMPHIHHHSRASSSEPQPGHLLIFGHVGRDVRTFGHRHALAPKLSGHFFCPFKATKWHATRYYSTVIQDSDTRLPPIYITQAAIHEIFPCRCEGMSFQFV